MAKSETEASVEALLMNSEKAPETEIQAALNAVAEFALLECELIREGFLDMARKAWTRAQATGRSL